MCVIEAIDIASSVLSTAVNIKKAKDQTGAMVQQAQVLRDNAAIERQTGLEEARKIKLKSILKMGEVKAQSAAGNIATSSGTTLNAIDTEKLNGDMEALSTVKRSERNAKKYISQSDLLLKKARMNNENMYLNAATGMLSLTGKLIGTI